ncbi:MAG: aspartyl protease family protein [Acidobacteriia bacterium]|nr:aspartyl protease family protein [Terriglobia bacterium]
MRTLPYALLTICTLSHASVGLPLEQKGAFLLLGGVSIAGHGPYRFLIDTGAESSVISPMLAESLKLAPVYTVEVQSTVGTRLAPAYRLTAVSASGISTSGPCADAIEALSYPLTAVEKAVGPLDGILGQNFFHKFNFILDLQRRTLWMDPAGRVVGDRVAFTNSAGRLQIPVSLPSGNAVRNLILDSGASHLVLFAPVKLDLPREAFLDTSSGSQKVTMGRLALLKIGGQSWKRLPAASLPRPLTHTSDGLLPIHLFRSVYFNHTGGYVIFNPVFQPH